WPNDIYVGDQKLGGILIQNSILPTAINSSVVGIGINVNQVDFPPSLPNPCSLATLTRKDKNVRKLTARLCQHLERRYLQLKAGKHRQMQEEYLLCLYKFMEETLFQTADGRLISGRITGVTESGKLSIHHTNGAEHFGLKEIQLIQRS
ncbi:MAG: biotin--[acetyl-CoA-carboxylase] ligase, partial [Bacteroidota bacterium]